MYIYAIWNTSVSAHITTMADLVVVLLFICDNRFGSHVVGGTTPNFLLHTRMLGHDSIGYAKVNELKLHPPADKVLGLEVIVYYTLFMNHLQKC